VRKFFIFLKDKQYYFGSKSNSDTIIMLCKVGT